jgi:hypothetical protein
MTLLKTAQGLEGEALDVWLETLNPEEKKELWVQCTEAVLEVLSRIAGVFGPTLEEVCDGKVLGNARG